MRARDQRARDGRRAKDAFTVARLFLRNSAGSKRPYGAREIIYLSWISAQLSRIVSRENMCARIRSRL